MIMRILMILQYTNISNEISNFPIYFKSFHKLVTACQVADWSLIAHHLPVLYEGLWLV